VKKDRINSTSASAGITKVPLMACTMMPNTSVKGVASLSMIDLSNTPPPSTHFTRPAIAQTMTMA
jgi:hypothetical protein